MGTITFTVAGPMQPVFNSTTTITKNQSLVSTATWSAGDVYMLSNIKIPHGAVITDVSYKGSVVDGTYLLEFGLTDGVGTTTIDVFGSKTFSATAVTTLTAISTGIPHTVSVSDDAGERYKTFAVRVDGAATSGTTSVSLQFVVQYYCK
jgi:hypothetical protein